MTMHTCRQTHKHMRDTCFFDFFARGERRALGRERKGIYRNLQKRSPDSTPRAKRQPAIEKDDRRLQTTQKNCMREAE